MLQPQGRTDMGNMKLFLLHVQFVEAEICWIQWSAETSLLEAWIPQSLSHSWRIFIIGAILGGGVERYIEGNFILAQ